MRSPVPRDEVRLGSRRPGERSSSPDALAISITAILPGTTAYCASTGSPKGPETTTLRSSPPSPATIASRVPSPPSAIGTTSMVASGSAWSHPAAMARAACSAVSVPLNLSGATRTRIGPGYNPRL